MVLFDKHPWDWVAHFILGLVIFYANFGLMGLVGFFIFAVSINFVLAVAIAGAINFVIAVELTQFDIFGFEKRRILDSIIDFVADIFGIAVGFSLFLMV